MTINPYGRPIAGRLNGIHADVGVILGPKVITREYVVVIGNDDRGVIVGYATRQEIDAILTPGYVPRSIAEIHLRNGGDRG